ncbi:hypothetical protein [Streptomyces rochei]|uniref:hypothetical protein n=1 Tax=Streptomyces rochei TaxID=1928 RepID=UPI00369FEA4D
MKRLHHDHCICGKQMIFDNEQQAYAYIKSRQGIRLGLVSYYRCEEANKVHVTSKLPKNERTLLNTVERELKKEMATIKDFVIDYMQVAYRSKNQVEFTTTELKKAYAKKFPNLNANSVATAVFALKKENIIVDLGKPVPNMKNGKATFFTLVKIMDEETNPVSKKTVAVPSQSQPTQEAKKPTPNFVAANPFDKVHTRLDEMLTIVKGLAQGYSEMAKQTPGISQAQTILDNTDKILKEVRAEAKSNSNAYVEIMNTLHSKSTAPVEIKADVIADAVNLRLTDLTKEDALIYRIREEVAAITDAESKWIVENIQVPEGVSNQNDYREGIREGIRLASEMNLVIRKVKD